ncbi:small GTP-binding protein [Tritrichomonas foetus]|uniref:Small GTP-binding protein n=1 Tax=Tritrichomonas foetus TaxID=1144522 RepID=A0A1J4JTC9_9EUKA|nr:small GTP-binding protein [Tritrichomonas foetus]|eukprot:OHT01680.1 small GTP-binding protein [Tritrichomonas foetus]
MMRNLATNPYKVCICGEYNVGKTALVNRYVTDLFSESYRPTIAACFTAMTVNLNGREVQMNVWDTAGQEKYQSMLPLYLQDANCVFLVVDITKQSSWRYALKWVEQEWNNLNPSPLLIICLNKCDLQPNFDLEEVAEWASQMEIPIVQTSALSGSNVKLLFEKAARMLDISNHRAAVGVNVSGQANSQKCC